ncbi:MAG TPA: Hsp20/alpha crystallin family protein [Bacteroidales bacterium]|nr:Hsp20/alpha crystallin family protein [Bacteroidales bacterium]HCI55828.1 hypothetical protein [Bacteroidales bacterium]HRC89444.1 Hsp20/alpha crystallin family protein [Bacteroidales bacterium]
MLPTIIKRGERPSVWSNLFDDDFLAPFFSPLFSTSYSSLPAVNIKEDDKQYTLDVAVPGIDKKDLKIEIEDDILTISSEQKEEKEENRQDYKRREFSYSSFSRSFTLPENVNKEKIEANYKDGILSVVLPKTHEEKSKITKQVKIA